MLNRNLFQKNLSVKHCVEKVQQTVKKQKKKNQKQLIC